jgi:hypothetical protein
MATFTPTSSSAAIAGFGFWALVWATAQKLDTIALLFGLRKSCYSKRVRLWINQNKGLTLCLTEIINFSIHGLKSSEGVTFALGGTLFNCLYVLFFNPLICWRKSKTELVVQAKVYEYEGRIAR